MNSFAQYYTQTTYSNLLISGFKQNNPSIIIELAIGEGSLLKAAYLRWDTAEYYGIDLDNENVIKTKSKFPQAQIYNNNGLSQKISSILKIKAGTADIAICNPPYLSEKINSQYIKLFSQVGLRKCKDLPLITTDLVFLAQNLKMLKKGGELGIIIPDTLLTSHQFRIFREAILKNHQVTRIIQLPDNAFTKTEARTHIIYITKKGITQPLVPILLASLDGNISDTLQIEPSQLIHRMDYSFHKWRVNNTFLTNLTLKDLGVEIKRGRYSSIDIKKNKLNIFHSTSYLGLKSSSISLPKQSLSEVDGNFAKKGDILLCRVGKRCVGRLAIVKSGQQLISDCILRIRVPQIYQKLVWESLNSEEGQQWLSGNVHGVCAQVISKSDLLNFPIKLS